jgi:hypothetical protein
MVDTAPPSGTIDITGTVESLRSAWVDFMVAFLFGEEIAIPGMEWVAAPIISSIDKEVLKIIMNVVSKDAVMMMFFQNTAVRKASQAVDFNATVKAKNSLPDTASPEEFKNAEQAQMVAFRNFVMLSN